MHTKRQTGSHSLRGCVPFFPSDWKSGNITSGPVLRRRIRSTGQLNEMTGKCTLNSGSWQKSHSSRNLKVPVVSKGLPERHQQNLHILNQSSWCSQQYGACLIELFWTVIIYTNYIFVLDVFITPRILKQNLLIIALTPFYE